jgi:hypothetical protein
VTKIAFGILRVLVGLASLASLALTGLIILVTGFFNLAKGLFGAVGSVITVFASGFQKNPPVPDPDPAIPLPLIGLAILFAAMFASVFMPGQKIFLHIVAAMALIAVIWEAWRTFHATPEMLYTPVIVLWAVYYALCLRRVKAGRETADGRV